MVRTSRLLRVLMHVMHVMKKGVNSISSKGTYMLMSIQTWNKGRDMFLQAWCMYRDDSIDGLHVYM
jgi:hypothetical protein